MEAEAKLEAVDLEAFYGAERVLKRLRIPLVQGAVTAVIGPSGSGKTTLLRCLSRMHELTSGARVQGAVLLDGMNIYDPAVDASAVRRRVATIAAKPNPFPSMSVRENVLSGLTLSGIRAQDAESIVESCLHEVGLWDQIKDRLRIPATALSTVEQQQLCIARSLALRPEVILLDEPCSVLDPMATARIEDLMHDLRERYTLGIATHSMQQAARVSDHVAFVLSGELIEYSDTDRLFTRPSDVRTEDYLTGRFG